MKIKYFLRGLGMGIILSAVLLTIVGGTQKETLTEEEIMTRASLLGMVKAQESQPPASTETPEPATQTPASTETPEPEDKTPATESPKSEDRTPATETPNPGNDTPASDAPEETQAPEASEPPAASEEPDYATVTIKGGMWSKDVAKAMAAAGLVDSAEDFDDYLCDNGYASYISVGTYRIREGADYSEIAEAITK